MKVSWFSAGVSSAVATKIASPDRIIYIDIDDQHRDTYRFISECEEWFGVEIEMLKSLYDSVDAVCRANKFIKSPNGAVCTRLLKKRVRQEWEIDNPGKHTYVWGFDLSEQNRANRTENLMPNFEHEFPILNREKHEVHGILERAGIKRPAMYDLGYPNNNCLGCVKGDMGYWNKIRTDFPEVFASRVKMERDIGGRMLKECYLDELDPESGRHDAPICDDCGIFCELDAI